MKNRVDKELVSRGLINSRAKAQELIENGLVKCNGKIVSKSNILVDEQDTLEILENDLTKYVSRGGLKLEEAINKFGIDFTGLKVIDIGSSTGGFCDCALKHGASKIIAIDVGTDVMVEELRNDSRIDLHEQTNFKDLESDYYKDIDIITCDVSFISLKPIVKKVYDENIKIDMICLIKPQFECGMETANKYKGIPLSKKVHLDIINNLKEYFNSLNFYFKNLTCSPIKGGDGNIEYLLLLSNKIDNNVFTDIESIVKEAFK